MAVVSLGGMAAVGPAVFPRNRACLHSLGGGNGRAGRRDRGTFARIGAPDRPMRHSIYAAAVRRGMWRKAGGFDSRRIQPHSRLKWLNSLYRPALPEENRGNAIVP